jgi:hypothetical protein
MFRQVCPKGLHQERLVPSVTESQLRDAPQFSDDSWEDRDWETRTHEHYGAPPYWGDGRREAA